MESARMRQTLLFAVASLALGASGCLAAAVGAGAAAAGVAYAKGQYHRDYPANLEDAQAAFRTGLVELHLPVLAEEQRPGHVAFQSKTRDGAIIRVELDTLSSRLPDEGQVTRAAIRVGAFGDEAVSFRIFDQAGLHLVAPGPAGVVGPMPLPASLPVPANNALPSVGAATSEPPLLPSNGAQ